MTKITGKQKAQRRLARPRCSAPTTEALRAKLYVRLAAKRSALLKVWKQDAIRVQDFETAANLSRAQKCLERIGETTIELNDRGQARRENQ